MVDPAHYAQIKRAAHYIPSSQMDVFFLKAFPARQTFLKGLKQRLKSVAPIHLQHLRSLLNHFTLLQVDHALETATGHGIFTVTYVEDMLKTYYPSQTGLRTGMVAVLPVQSHGYGILRSRSWRRHRHQILRTINPWRQGG